MEEVHGGVRDLGGEVEDGLVVGQRGDGLGVVEEGGYRLRLRGGSSLRQFLLFFISQRLLFLAIRGMVLLV